MVELPNLPVPDELAQVRAQIRLLGERESILRQLLLTEPELRTGAAYLAVIKTAKRTTTDIKEMRAMYPDIVEQFTFALDVTSVVLQGITEDGEVVSVRQMKKEQAA